MSGAGEASSAVRIVVADDHEPTRALLRAMLDLVPGVGAVAEARDGAEAVKLAVKHRADVVLLDVRMPVMDGLEAAELIGLARPQTSLFLHSADPDLAMQRRADELGVRLFVKSDFQEIVAALELESVDARRGAPVPGDMEIAVLFALAARSAVGSAVYLSLLSEIPPGEAPPSPVDTVRVLVAEPDDLMREAIRIALLGEGFAVVTVADGQAVLERALAERYDAVVLDAELSRVSGRKACQLLRVESDVPIILLASAQGVVERLLALEVGADDCLARPFATEELVARVRAILRRRRLDTPIVAPTVRKLGGLLIDLVSRQLFVEGELVELTPSEFKVLALLSREPDRLFTRREIMENLWDSTYVGDERVCDTHISNLRRKIERNPAHPERIVTVRGAGYKLAFL